MVFQNKNTFFVLVFIWIITANGSPPISQGSFINSGTPTGVTLDFDCDVRKYAYQYGMSLQPRHGKFVELFDALQLNACNQTRPNDIDSWIPPNLNTIDGECSFYVDPNNGNDSNSGSISSPFLSIERGINETRIYHGKNAGQQCYLYLRSGIFYLTETIEINAEDSYLTIQNYNGEKVTISGGLPLDFGNNEWKLVDFEPIGWKVYNNSNNCWGRSGTTNSNDLIDNIGHYTDLGSCMNAIKASNVEFRSFCWNDPVIGGVYAGGCYGVKDFSWQPYYQSDIYSGRIEGKNIWSNIVANVGDLKDGIPGLRVNDQRGIKARYPDTIPEQSMQFDPISGWIPYSTKWIPPKIFDAPINVIYTADNYSNTDVIWPMVNPGYNNTNQYTGMGTIHIYFE